jgi:acetyl-CoA carboxylase beta subunit
MKKKMKTILENQIGCGEMSNVYTFTLTVQDEVDGSEPLTEQGAIDYIIFRLEAQSVIQVLNIVRDY